jgi:ATP-binding cassette subfamily B protein
MNALIKRLMDISGNEKGKIYAAFIFTFVKAILSKAPIIIAFVAIAKFSNGTMNISLCIWLGIVMALCLIVQTAMQNLADRIQSTVGYMVFAEKRLEMGEHLRRMPMGYFTEGNIGKISSILTTDMVFVEGYCMNELANIMSYIFAEFVMILFLLLFNVWLGLTALLFLGVVGIISKYMRRKSLKDSEARQERSEDLTSAVLEFVEGIGIIKTYQAAGEKQTNLSDNFRKTRELSLEYEKSQSGWQLGLFIVYGIGATAIIALSLFLAASGYMDKMVVIGILLFAFDLFAPVKALYSSTSLLAIMNSCMDRIDAVFDETELSDDGVEEIPSESSEPEIKFHEVSFGYYNIRHVPISALMNHVSMVFQRVYLFNDTIYSNIIMGRPNASPEEVMAAAKKARCHDFIMALPDGFDTVVGEGGSILSGGEKQRISIARCILKDAPIVILDEATASVDADNESYIQEAINELCKGKTLLVIAHRLGTVRNANEILVIADGGIKEQGSHEELMNRQGLYSNFVNIRGQPGWNQK